MPGSTTSFVSGRTGSVMVSSSAISAPFSTGRIQSLCRRQQPYEGSSHSPPSNPERVTLNTVSLGWSPVVLAQSTDPTPLQQACGDDPSYVCRRVLEWTDSTGWAEAADKLLATPAHILLVLLAAFVANRLVRRAIRRLTNKIAAPESQDRLRNLRRRRPGGGAGQRLALAALGRPGPDARHGVARRSPALSSGRSR